jgi:hypothetical protein
VYSAPFVVVVAAAAVVFIMFIHSCSYEDTSYTLDLFLCVSQWYDNDKHDLPQHVIMTVKWRDDIVGNKCRSITISSIPVPDTVSMCICHYTLFPFPLLHADSF